MRITPIINAYNLKSPVYLAKNNLNAKNKAVSTIIYTQNFGNQDKKDTQNNSPIYYYDNIEYPNEQRIYSSRNKDLLDRPANFLINKIDNIPCPSCGKIMLPRDKFDIFLQELDETKPEEYINLLDKYKDYMRPVELSVYNEICELSKSTGETDIRTLITGLRENKIPQLQRIQMSRLKQMRRIARTLPQDEKTVLLNKLEKLQGYIRNTKTEAPFRRKIMIDRISKLKISNPHKYKKMQIIAQSFPTSSDVNSAWIVKYSGNNKQGEPWDSKSIAIRMLEFSVPNTDHILARGIEMHHDDIDNYMSIHSGCNGHKANKPILQWYNENRDERKQNLTAYFRKVQELISTGKITDKRYENYVANATNLLKDISNGQIDISI